jgi:CBS domain-containing protein
MDRSVTVQEVMDREFVGVSESDDLRETVELMVGEESECVLVLRGREPVGVLTERDVLEQIVAGTLDSATVADAMADAPPTADPEMTLSEAADVLSARGTQRLVVTNDEEPAGILTEHDLLSTSPFSQPSAAETPQEEAVLAAGGENSEAISREQATEGSYQEQAICEACGTFARDLSAFNGQLLCADCRDI